MSDTNEPNAPLTDEERERLRRIDEQIAQNLAYARMDYEYRLVRQQEYERRSMERFCADWEYRQLTSCRMIYAPRPERWR